jgi:hypothetical protein
VNIFTAGSATEGTLPPEPRPEVTEKTILDKAAECLWWTLSYFQADQAQMEARRYQDGTGDPDYGRRLRELEGQIAEIDREQSSFKMGDYHEGGGNRWDKWAMPGLVTLAVSGIIGNVVQSMTVSALRQEVADLQKEVDHIEKLIEPRYRGG